MVKPLFSPFAWGALALGSALPLILWQELSGNPVPVWLLLAQALALLALLVAAHRLPALRPFENLLRWLLCLAVGWHLILGGVFATPAWQEWQQDVPWVVRGAVAQALIFVPSLLLVFTGVGRRSLQDLRSPGATGARPRPPTP